MKARTSFTINTSENQTYSRVVVVLEAEIEDGYGFHHYKPACNINIQKEKTK